MDQTPCSDSIALVHAALLALNSVSLCLAGWLALRRRTADKERRLLASQLRYQLLRENALLKNAGGREDGPPRP